MHQNSETDQKFHLFGAQNLNQLSKLDADQVGHLHLLVHQVHLQLDTDTVQNVVVVDVDNILGIAEWPAEWVGKNDLILEKKTVQHWSLIELFEVVELVETVEHAE